MDVLQARFPPQQRDSVANPRTQLAAMSVTWGAVADFCYWTEKALRWMG